MTRYKPNVIRGGRATNIKGNLYYMSGRKHEAGGIDIGKNPRTGLEVEDGEVVQTSSNGLKVFSAQPILNGNSPAKLVMGTVAELNLVANNAYTNFYARTTPMPHRVTDDPVRLALMVRRSQII